ncbi:MAG: 1-(5-phosphoribosyl)-5-[(5-phosphoribosylamino)methylideneamino]imidazole-4-carboxamide isomerase [Evtepia sp.]|nr:1-(5-phosphoribosyl)-5-[(5-phosphoribosylamino)methylideneamino]imidazole-4-carboxamide isomerase [Evtepia sp.]
MKIFPAIDLFGGQAVRLYKGDYDQMTVYDPEPLNTVRKFEAAGASNLHLVDLEGAKTGQTTNLPTIEKLAKSTGLFIEVGGGIRNMDTVRRYLDAGASRVILGTAAVTDPDFTAQAVAQYGEKIAVGADLKDGKVAIKGWLETSQDTWEVFFEKMQALGVKTIICTDISKDGAMQGTNRALYKELTQRFSMDIIASGGVSSLEDIRALKAAGVHGAIIGKAYYTGAIDLAQAIRLGEGEETP